MPGGRQVKLAIAIAGACFTLACGGSTDSDGGSGGGSTGGASTGGASTGGASSGGAGAVSGSGGSVGGSPGAGGITGLGPECTTDAECTLFSDCCTCEAYGPDQAPPPSCLAACTQNACEMNGASTETVQCVAGRCVAGIPCTGQVFCNAIPPECGPGQTPAILNGCWGGCVPVTECASVPSCDECDGTLMTCVSIDHSGGDGGSQHCVDIPKGCEGTPDCACMGQNVCVSPTSDCQDLSGLPGVACSCNACD